MKWYRENDYDAEIRKARSVYPDVPVSIIKAVIGAESAFNPRAFRIEPHIITEGSPDGSAGLMQLLLRTARELGYGGTIPNLYIPALNIYYGTMLLSENFSRTGSWPGALSMYNGGYRPSLGFGEPATRTVTVCLARNAQGDCVSRHTVRAGEYANQVYVNKVLGFVRYFAHDKATAPPKVHAPIVSAPSAATADKGLATLGTGTLAVAALGALGLLALGGKR